MPPSDFEELETLYEKMTAFLETQRRIVSEFQRSLVNARHFLELARLAMEREPANTVAMLEQIRDIDLVGSLENQFETFENMEQVLPSGEGIANTREEEWEELRQQYRELIEEAAQQDLEAGNLLQAIGGNG